jgi:hypothetical protein
VEAVKAAGLSGSRDDDQPSLFPEALAEYEQGKDELNMAEFPLSLPGKTLRSRRGVKNDPIVEFKDHIRDKRTCEAIERTVTISGSPKYGLPTYYDEEILFGILQLTHHRRRHAINRRWPKTVTFSRYELASVLGLSTGGQSYARLGESIARLGSTTYEFSYAWFDNQDKEWQSGEGMNFIQSFSWAEDAGGRVGDYSVTWADQVHRSFEAGYLRDIDFLEYRALKLPMAKVLYRFLGKHFWRKSRQSFDLKVLAHQKLGLSTNYDVGQVKQALAPAVKRLEERGFIVPEPTTRRYTKLGKGKWQIHFEHANAGRSSRAALPEPPEVPTELEQRLRREGVTSRVAAELLADHPPELIERKLDVLAWLDAHGRPPKTSRGGFLAQSIREKWSDPDGYVSREQRDAAERLERQRLEAAKTHQAAQKEAERAYDKAAAEREKLARRRLKSMTDDERDELRREALGESPNRLQVRHAETFMLAQLIEQMDAVGDLPLLPEPRKYFPAVSSCHAGRQRRVADGESAACYARPPPATACHAFDPYLHRPRRPAACGDASLHQL